MLTYMKNKDKPKKGQLPTGMVEDGRYLAARTVSDVWICYPWEATFVIRTWNDPCRKADNKMQRYR